MAGCIENLLAQSFGNFNGLKNLNRSPLEDRVQGLVHGSPPLCCYYNILMLLLQHGSRAASQKAVCQVGRNLDSAQRQRSKRIKACSRQVGHSAPYCTVKSFVLVDVPPAFVTEILPVVAPVGTVTRM